MSSTVEYRATEELPEGVNVAIAARHGSIVFLVRSSMTVPEAMKAMTAIAVTYMADYSLVRMLGA